MNILNGAINETVKSTVLQDHMNLWELPEKCPCGFPMHLKSGGALAHCPKCTSKKEQAMNGREVLARAKARAAEKSGPLSFEDRAKKGMSGAFLSGMPL